MAYPRDIGARVRQMWLPIVGAIVLAYFSYHMIQGNHGALAMLDLRAKVAVAQSMRDELRAERQALELRVALLRPDHLDPDMLEERARVMLNFVRPDELVILDRDARR